MKYLMTVVIACLWFACSPLSAQAAANPPPQDPIAPYVLPPELIMQNQQAIGLTDAQKNAVIAEIKQVQGHAVDAQWDLQRAVEGMVALLKQDKVDEQAVLVQLDKLLAVERDVKRQQLTLVVRLKNILSPEQQRKLRELRANK